MCNSVKMKGVEFLKELLSEPNLDENECIKVGRYAVDEDDLQAEVAYWSLQYLALKRCPRHLMCWITNRAIQKRSAFDECDLLNSGAHDSGRVAQVLITIAQAVCQALLDDEKLMDNLAGTMFPVTSECSERNRRRMNEDRFVSIPDLMSIYEAKHTQRDLGFYAVFDGHGGSHASHYSAAHLPYNLAASIAMEETCLTAISNAFSSTDSAFAKKCDDPRVRGGTTVVCALHDVKEHRLHVSWLGDSKALLVKEGQLNPIVRPHIPTDPKESQRITEQGGSIMYWGGVMRVNGALAVSRSIGDLPHKPYVSSEPETETIELDGKEDFVVLSSDGLWENVPEEDIANEIYRVLRDSHEDADKVAARLVNMAKESGASDNITVVVVYLKEPQKISSQIASGLIPLLDSS